MRTNDQAAAVNAPLSDEVLLKNLRALKKWRLVLKITLYASLTGAFALIAVFGVNDMIIAGFACGAGWLILSCVIYLYANKQQKKLKDMVGRDVILPILRESFEVKEYSPNKHLSSNLVNSAGLIDDWTEIDGSDYIEGSYNGINILYSDLLLRRKEVVHDEDGKRTTYVTVFKGQWLVCDFSKELAASVRLIEGGGKGNIETENIEFNKKYRIYTGDGHTAFYLLTPRFMERLIAADNAVNAATHFCFQDGKVHIAMNSGRDSFELKRVKLNNLDNVQQQFRRDLKYMTGIIDELLHNDKIFKEN